MCLHIVSTLALRPQRYTQTFPGTSQYMHITHSARLLPGSPARRADWWREGHDNEQYTVGKYASRCTAEAAEKTRAGVLAERLRSAVVFSSALRFFAANGRAARPRFPPGLLQTGAGRHTSTASQDVLLLSNLPHVRLDLLQRVDSSAKMLARSFSTSCTVLSSSSPKIYLKKSVMSSLPALLTVVACHSKKSTKRFA